MLIVAAGGYALRTMLGRARVLSFASQLEDSPASRVPE